MSTHHAARPWTDGAPSKQRPAITPRAGFTDPGNAAGEDWRKQAECAEPWYSLNLFFPITYTGDAVAEQIEDARAACRRCPVQQACLQWAVATRERSGIWGGATPDERDAVVRRAVRQRGRGAA